MGDAEWMYENDLDPFHRKDENTGELVEWEGGLNPAYEVDGNSDPLYGDSGSKELLDINMFHTFEDAKAWAKENPGRSFTKSPDGKGYIVKYNKLVSTASNIKEHSNKQYSNIRPSVYKKIKNYTNREGALANNLTIHSMLVTKDLASKVERYAFDNNLLTDCTQEDRYDTFSDSDYNNYKSYPRYLRYISFWYTPKFSVKFYNHDFVSIISSEGSVDTTLYWKLCGKIMGKNAKDKARRCKTILDLYFDILNTSPNDLIDISFDAS